MIGVQGVIALLIVGGGFAMGRAVYSQAPVGLAAVAGMLVITDRVGPLYWVNLLGILALALISLVAQMGVNEMAAPDKRDTTRETTADLAAMAAGVWMIGYYLVATALWIVEPTIINIVLVVVSLLAITLLVAAVLRIRRRRQINASRQSLPSQADTAILGSID